MRIIYIFILFLFTSCSQASNKQQVTEENEIKQDTTVLIDPVDQFDTFAEFPGGKDSLINFINQKLVIPDQLTNNQTKGRVYIRIKISEKGKVTNPVIVRSLSKEADEEALRVMKLLPDFIPATRNDKPVASYYGLYVDFN